MGFRIKELSHEQGMRMGELAHSLKMPLSNLSAINAGYRSVSLPLLTRIAKRLGCTVPELFEEEKPASAFRNVRLEQAVRQLEASNPFGIEKGWVHRLNFALERHFKSVRDGETPYGAKRPMDADPYTQLIDGFNKASVDHVVIGMVGINYYARSAAESFLTKDFDLLLKPSFENLSKAVRVFHNLGYETMTTEGVVGEKELRAVLQKKKTLLAVDHYGVTFEVLFKVSGFSFRQMTEDAAVFRAGETLVRVGKLSKLLASKRAANRPKDRLFLKRYEILLKEMPQKPSGGTTLF